MGSLDQGERDEISAKQYALTKQRKEPLVDATHVRSAITRFNQVEGVSDAARDEAWKRIRAAARKLDIAVAERDWRELKIGARKSA